mgnify:FL=1
MVSVELSDNVHFPPVILPEESAVRLIALTDLPSAPFAPAAPVAPLAPAGP